MTNVLYWNIDNFQMDTIQRNVPSVTDSVAMSVDRCKYILDLVEKADPDIFIIVEPVVDNWTTGPGVLSTGKGWGGIFALWGFLKTAGLVPTVNNRPWALVPPLVTGREETVAVFFRTDRVQFTGPNIWTGGNGPIGAGGAGDYPIGRNTLPDTGTVNSNSAFNAGANLAQCAANVRYQTVANPLADIDFGNNINIRRPFQTTFWDLVTNRNINIFTVHSPANTLRATTFLNRLVSASAITRDLGTDEVRLVLGDFNFNLLSNLNFYAPMTALGYVVALCPQNDAPVPPLGFNGFFSTTVKPTNAAQCASQNQPGDPRYYPGYAYATGQSLDNILYRSNLVIDPKITLVNKVVGSPFTAVTPAAAPVTEQAVQPFLTSIDWTWNGQNPNAPAPPQNEAPLYQAYEGFDAAFQAWNQYGKIRSTSDHLPLFFTF